MPENKVKYGLSRVHIAKATIGTDGSATFDTPQALPGAVDLTLERNGDNTKFFADNIVYFNTPGAPGYNGDLNIANLTEWFKTNILGHKVDAAGNSYEPANPPIVPYAMLFEIKGDAHATRHCIYNLTCEKPAHGGSTQTDSTEPNTTTLTQSSGPIYVESLVDEDNDGWVVACNSKPGDPNYNTFFDSVYIPTGTAPVPPTPENQPEG